MSEKDKYAEDSMKRIFAFLKVRDEKQANLTAAEIVVKSCRRELDKADAMVFAAIREESQPSLFSPGVQVDDGDMGKARAELVAAEKKAEADAERKRQEDLSRAAGSAPHSGSAPPAEQPPVPPGEEWRNVRTDSLNLPATLAKAIGNCGKDFSTLGLIADWKKQGGTLVSGGLSEAKARMLEDILAAYFAAAAPAEPGVEPASEPASEKPPEAEAGAEPKKTRKPKTK